MSAQKKPKTEPEGMKWRDWTKVEPPPASGDDGPAVIQTYAGRVRHIDEFVAATQKLLTLKPAEHVVYRTRAVARPHNPFAFEFWVNNTNERLEWINDPKSAAAQALMAQDANRPFEGGKGIVADQASGMCYVSKDRRGRNLYRLIKFLRQCDRWGQEWSDEATHFKVHFQYSMALAPQGPPLLGKLPAALFDDLRFPRWQRGPDDNTVTPPIVHWKVGGSDLVALHGWKAAGPDAPTAVSRKCMQLAYDVWANCGKEAATGRVTTFPSAVKVDQALPTSLHGCLLVMHFGDAVAKYVLTSGSMLLNNTPSGVTVLRVAAQPVVRQPGTWRSPLMAQLLERGQALLEETRRTIKAEYNRTPVLAPQLSDDGRVYSGHGNTLTTVTSQIVLLIRNSLCAKLAWAQRLSPFMGAGASVVSHNRHVLTLIRPTHQQKVFVVDPWATDPTANSQEGALGAVQKVLGPRYTLVYLDCHVPVQGRQNNCSSIAIARACAAAFFIECAAPVTAAPPEKIEKAVLRLACGVGCPHDALPDYTRLIQFFATIVSIARNSPTA